MQLVYSRLDCLVTFLHHKECGKSIIMTKEKSGEPTQNNCSLLTLLDEVEHIAGITQATVCPGGTPGETRIKQRVKVMFV